MNMPRKADGVASTSTSALFVEAMEKASRSNILRNSLRKVLREVKRLHPDVEVVFLGPGAGGVEKKMMDDLDNFLTIDPDPTSFGSGGVENPVAIDFSTYQECLEANPEMGADGSRAVMVVCIWPPYQYDGDLEEGMELPTGVNDPFDWTIFEDMNVVGALVMYSPDGSSGSKAFVENFPDWGHDRVSHTLVYGRGFGLAGQTICLRGATKEPYDGFVDGASEPVHLSGESCGVSYGCNLVRAGSHRRFLQASEFMLLQDDEEGRPLLTREELDWIRKGIAQYTDANSRAAQVLEQYRRAGFPTPDTGDAERDLLVLKTLLGV